jgi:hypothetical protein
MVMIMLSNWKSMPCISLAAGAPTSSRLSLFCTAGKGLDATESSAFRVFVCGALNGFDRLVENRPRLGLIDMEILSFFGLSSGNRTGRGKPLYVQGALIHQSGR